MRALFILGVLIIFALPCRSQILISILFGDKLNTEKLEYGLNVGENLTTISNLNSREGKGLALGFYFNVKLSENLFIHPEVQVQSMFGAKRLDVYSTGDASIDGLFEQGNVNRKIKYLCVPILIRYRVAGRLFAEAGPQLNMCKQAFDLFESDINGNDLTYKINIKDQVTRFDAGAALGLEYKFGKDKGIGIGARYYTGFVDVLKMEDGNQSNQQWLLRISVPITGLKTN